jgi:NAD/NADP transhydrogenase beta subunit
MVDGQIDTSKGVTGPAGPWVAEVAGALGLILPSLLRIQPRLTPVSALRLVIIMIGATVLTGMAGPVAMAAMPAVVGLLAGFVAYARTWIAPIEAASETGIKKPLAAASDVAACREPSTQ